eukprot:scaffold149_cov383-Prasinococcus_capsulatus_cf.AAC.7
MVVLTRKTGTSRLATMPLFTACCMPLKAWKPLSACAAAGAGVALAGVAEGAEPEAAGAAGAAFVAPPAAASTSLAVMRP